MGQNLEVRTEEMINKVKNFVLTERQVNIEIIANEMEILETNVSKILHDDFGSNKMRREFNGLIPR